MNTMRPVLFRPLSIVPAAVLASLATLTAGEEPPVMMPAPSVAASSGLDAEFHVGYSSDYIFRGGYIGSNLFEFGLDFAGSGNVGVLGDLDWSAGVWYGSYSMDTYMDAANNELDVYGEVSKSFNDMFSVAVGIINLSYFGNGAAVDDDIDPYVSLGAEIAGISLGATLIYDGANNYRHDVYLEFTAAYEAEIAERLTAGVEGKLGWFDESDVDPSDDDDLYVAGTLSASYAVSDNISVSPYMTAKFSDNLGDHFYGGVLIGFSF